jgi:hypothetical protein
MPAFMRASALGGAAWGFLPRLRVVRQPGVESRVGELVLGRDGRSIPAAPMPVLAQGDGLPLAIDAPEPMFASARRVAAFKPLRTFQTVRAKSGVEDLLVSTKDRRTKQSIVRGHFFVGLELSLLERRIICSSESPKSKCCESPKGP